MKNLLLTMTLAPLTLALLAACSKENPGTAAAPAAPESSEGWVTDYDKALAQAKKENKLILADFNGSDWCPPCKALRKDVFSDAKFVAFAKESLVLLDVDFPRAKKLSEEQQKHNEKLQEKFNVDGFPTVVVLDSDGKVLAKEVGYDGESANDYINKLKKLKAK